MITFVVFPGVALDTILKFLEGINKEDRASWKGWLVVFIFNVCDTCGRQLGSMKRFMISDKLTHIITYSRLIFIVTFFLVAYELNP